MLRVFLIFTVPLTVVLLFLFARINIKRFEQTIISQNQSHLAAIAQSGALNIENLILDVQDELETISENPVFLNWMETNQPYCENPDHSAFSPEDIVFGQMNKMVQMYYRLDSRGTVQKTIPSCPELLGRDFSLQKDILDAKHTNSLSYSDSLKEDNQYYFYLTQPVQQEKTFLGLIRVKISLSEIQSFTETIKVGQKGYAWIVDSHGNMIAHPVTEFIEKHIISYHRQLTNGLDSLDIEQMVSKMTRGETGTAEYRSAWWNQNTENLTKKIAAFAPIRFGSCLWSIGISMDYAEIAGPIQAYTLRMYSVVSGFLFMIAGAGFAFYRTYKKQAVLKSQAKMALQLQSLNEQLLLSEGKFRELADCLPQPVFEMDLNGNLTFSNKDAFQRFGYEPEEIHNGLTCMQMLAPEYRENARHYMARLAQ